MNSEVKNNNVVTDLKELPHEVKECPFCLNLMNARLIMPDGKILNRCPKCGRIDIE